MQFLSQFIKMASCELVINDTHSFFQRLTINTTFIFRTTYNLPYQKIIKEDSQKKKIIKELWNKLSLE